MSDREPVNIMGVIAFPEPDKSKRRIRFIDSLNDLGLGTLSLDGRVIKEDSNVRCTLPKAIHHILQRSSRSARDNSDRAGHPRNRLLSVLIKPS